MAPGRLGVGHEIVRQAVRRLHQLLLRLAVAHELHEAAHRVRLGREMRDPRLLEDAGRIRILADPDREDRLLAIALRPVAS